MALLIGTLILVLCGGALGIAISGFVATFAGIVTILGQIAVYLYSGEWHALTGIDTLRAFLDLFYSPADYPWISTPESWKGLHWVLASAPASVALIGFGFVLFLLAGIVRFVRG